MIMQNFWGQTRCIMGFLKIVNSVFSCDITAAMLVFLNNGMAAMLVSPTNPPGIELYYHANVFYCFVGKTRLRIT